MATVYLGVDIAKATFEAALWSGQGPQRLKSFPNTQAGFDQLAHALQQATEGLGPVRCHLVLEPTGGYELGLALWALEQGGR